MKKILTIGLIIFTLGLSAQDKKEITEDDYMNSEVEMADAFRADGKIYVVVAVLSVILTGFLLYTISIDRKISRIEKSLDKN